MTSCKPMIHNKIFITVTESIETVTSENKAPEPTFLINDDKNGSKSPILIEQCEIDNLKCLYCKKDQHTCEFSDTYCYNCGHCSCEYVCLKCHSHSYSCLEKCSEPDLVLVQNNYKTFTGGHFMEKNEKGKYLHHILCDCLDKSPETNKIELENNKNNKNFTQKKIDTFFSKEKCKNNNLNDTPIIDINEFYEEKQSTGNNIIDGIDYTVLNNYIYDNIGNVGNVDIEQYLKDIEQYLHP